MVNSVPKHIAFIMDGNGRWATKKLLPRKVGHREGVIAMQKVIEICNDIGVKVVSFYAFSTENWSRPQEEIDALFDLVLKFTSKELPKYAARNFRVRFMGDIDRMPDDVRAALQTTDELCKNNTGIIVNIGLNYGGRDEIARAAAKVAACGELITVDSISKRLDTADLPEPDIIVRSAGEKRLSNFMLWQASYSEFIFVDELWPDFDKKLLDNIITEYNNRKRKFGKVVDNA